MRVIFTIFFTLVAVLNSIESSNEPQSPNLPLLRSPLPKPNHPLYYGERPYILVIDGVVQRNLDVPQQSDSKRAPIEFPDGALLYRDINKPAIGEVDDNMIYERTSPRIVTPQEGDIIVFNKAIIAKYQKGRWRTARNEQQADEIRRPAESADTPQRPGLCNLSRSRAAPPLTPARSSTSDRLYLLVIDGVPQVKQGSNLKTTIQSETNTGFCLECLVLFLIACLQ